MKKSILFVSNYYFPYISGISEMERLLAEQLVKDGYRVKVITSRHDHSLVQQEVIDGVQVERCNVQLKISKGTVSIPFIIRVIKEARRYDVVNMQLPMLESGLLSFFIKKEKLIPIYHCDVNLPKSVMNSFIIWVMDRSHQICLSRSQRIWVVTKDYALHSRVAYRYRNKFMEIGVAMKHMEPGKYVKSEEYRIGFCGRIVEEKGIDVLLKAFELLQRQGMNAVLLIAGDYKNIAGGSVYPMLKNYIKKHRIKNVKFLGKVPEEKLAEFYSSLDVFVLPSTNTLEAFGLVQVEAMLCGTPVVASNLYGVRTIIKKTGMGLICQAGNPNHLAECIKTVLENREAYVKPQSEIRSLFSTRALIDRIYECINY